MRKIHLELEKLLRKLTQSLLYKMMSHNLVTSAIMTIQTVQIKGSEIKIVY
jgi:hypothetical protein